MKFVADAMLGKLAKWLRILGYDVAYAPASHADSLVKQAWGEKRVVLTRNHHLPRIEGVKVLLIESDHWREQLGEVIRGFRLRPGRNRFRRCILCNQRLVSLKKERAEGKVPDFVFSHFPSFLRCPECDRIYWQGSHLSGMEQIATQLRPRPKHSSGKEGP